MPGVHNPRLGIRVKVCATWPGCLCWFSMSAPPLQTVINAERLATKAIRLIACGL